VKPPKKNSLSGAGDGHGQEIKPAFHPSLCVRDILDDRDPDASGARGSAGERLGDERWNHAIAAAYKMTLR
jgi:hypothetical protein